MSGNGNFLPMPEWTRWLIEKFDPLVSRLDNVEKAVLRLLGNEEQTTKDVRALTNRLANVEKRLAIIEDEPDEEPQEPEEPGEPQEPEEPEEPVPGGFGDATHKVAPIINESFDPDSPTLRDGTPLTPNERRYYSAMMRGLLRPDPDDLTSDKQFSRENSYHLGRHGQIQQQMSLAAMSRTGDARILDEFVRRWNLAFEDLRITWRADNIDLSHRVFRNLAGARIENGKWVLSGGKTPWSPFPKWLYDWGSPSEGRGSDLNNLQNVKPWAQLVQFLWVLEVNRGKASPAGYDYGAEADKWRVPLRGLIETYTSDTGEPWEDNYEGRDGGLFWGPYRTRAKPGEWPFLVRAEGHAIYDSALLCYYCGLLGAKGWDIPNWQDAIAAADMLMADTRSKYVNTRDSKGRPSIITASGNSGTTVIAATYTNFLGMSLHHIRDVGRWDHLFDDETLMRLARSYVDMHRPDGTTLKNLASEVDRTGHGLNVSGGSDRSVHQQVVFGFCVAMLWEEGTYLFEVGDTAQNSRFGGGYDDAKSHIIPSIQFVDITGV